MISRTIYFVSTKKISNDKFKHLNRAKYNDHIDENYVKFKETVSEVMMGEIASIYLFTFINLIHDLCTSNSVDWIIGDSIYFID